MEFKKTDPKGSFGNKKYSSWSFILPDKYLCVCKYGVFQQQFCLSHQVADLRDHCSVT